MGSGKLDGCECDLVAELAKHSRRHLAALLFGPGIGFLSLFDKAHPFMQDLADHAAEPIEGSPDCRLVAQPRQQTSELLVEHKCNSN